MRLASAVVLALLLIHAPAGAKTDGEKAQERAAKDSVATAKQLAKMAAEAERRHPPSTFFRHRRAKQVSVALMGVMVDRGHSPTAVNEYMATFEKHASAVSSAILGTLTGGAANNDAKLRTMFTFTESDSGTQITCTAVQKIVNEGQRGAYFGDGMKDYRTAIKQMLYEVQIRISGAAPDTSFAH